MTTPPINQVVDGQGPAPAQIAHLTIALGYAKANGSSTPGAPVYDVRMTTVFPAVREWAATNVTPFRSPGEKSPCADASGECLCAYIRVGPMNLYFIPEKDLTYTCTVTP